MTCALETRSVCCRGSELPAVELVSLCAHWGEVLVILGCEDSGVSTLVRLLSGAVTPTAGKVFLVVLATHNPHLARIPGATIACIASGRLEAWGDRSVALPRR